jgi:hypothetical protein
MGTSNGVGEIFPACWSLPMMFLAGWKNFSLPRSTTLSNCLEVADPIRCVAIRAHGLHCVALLLPVFLADGDLRTEVPGDARTDVVSGGKLGGRAHVAGIACRGHAVVLSQHPEGRIQIHLRNECAASWLCSSTPSWLSAPQPLRRESGLHETFPFGQTHRRRCRLSSPQARGARNF